MNAKSDKVRQPHSKQLSEFAEKLQRQIADEDLLDDIHGVIEDLLWDDESVAADIRRILHDQHKAGKLRDETLELVERMLDRMVSENINTAPGVPEPEEQQADPFRETIVIEQLSADKVVDGDRLQVGSVLRDRFLLQEEISGGSMGVVYKALDRRLAEVNDVKPFVAIKVLTPQLSRDGNALRALQQEAAKGRCLSHPNIVRFIDVDRDDELYFIVMEWLDGRSLAAILDDSSARKIDKDMAFDIVKQIAKALDYAHLRGVVHADVKPGNVMLLPSGEIKLLDFGIARVRQQQSEGQTDIEPGMPGAVTPAYSSMQVLTREEPTAADDVFSLACLMYRLLAGYRVFGPRNAAEAAEAGMEPQRPQGLDDTEWAALRKALAYSRVSRFSSPKEFMDALGEPKPVQETQPVPILDEPEFERRRLWPSMLAVAVLIAGAWGLYEAGILDQLPSLSPPETGTQGDLQETTEQPTLVETEETEEPVLVDETEETEEPVLVDETEETEEPVLVDEEPFAGDETLVFETELPPEKEPVPQEPLVDFSTLPIATIQVPLAVPGTLRTESNLVLRENQQAAIVDLVRASSIEDVLLVKLEEISFSGSRSPWESGQYQISDESVARFPAGQDRVRFTVTMTSDSLREPDQQVSLLVRDFEDAESEFALIKLTLEDDDQRRFESGLGSNTVAFALGEVSVRERDPAVQINLVRYNPDQTTLTVKYILHEMTATEGKDYFVPGNRTVLFGPGQRSARILIPLVQDSNPEADEAFILELPGLQSELANENIFQRIAVMIRDDDSNIE